MSMTSDTLHRLWSVYDVQVADERKRMDHVALSSDRSDRGQFARDAAESEEIHRRETQRFIIRRAKCI